MLILKKKLDVLKVQALILPHRSSILPINMTSVTLPVCLPGSRDDESDPELQQDGRAVAAVRGAAPAKLESGCRERAALPERRPAGPT